MNNTILVGAAVCGGLSLTCAAMPTVTDVNLAQDAATRRVTIDYRLPNEAAIVTVDIRTNGVSIGARHFADVFGDVNALVQPTAGDAVRRIWWQPDVGWAFNRVTDGSLKAVVTAWSPSAPPDYMVIDFGFPKVRSYYATAEAIPGGVTNATYKENKMVMRRIPAAGVRWRMGSPTTEKLRAADETPHVVTLSKDYYMAVYPFTQGQYLNLMGVEHKSYSRAGSRKLPNYLWRPCEGFNQYNNVLPYTTVRGTSWPDERTSVGDGTILKQLRDATGIVTFDLPTEAQWEYACRAGSPAPTYLGLDCLVAYVDRIAWRKGTGDTGDSCAQIVGLKEPNAWGLHDMIGSVFEMCLDWSAPLGSAEETDPVGPSTGTTRVMRGCGMDFSGDGKGWLGGRTAARSSYNPTVGSLTTGFRPVCDIQVQ